MNGNGDVTQQRAHVVGISLFVYMRDPAKPNKVRQLQVPMTPQQSLSLLNFVKHRLHGGTLVLQPLPEEKRIIVP